MSKLLRAGVRRYLHSFVFWLGLIATAVLAMLCGHNTYLYYLDDFYIMLEFMVFAVVISWLIGREHAEGIFRNKVICGHTKGEIFLSELILAAGAAVVMFLIYAGIFTAFNSYTFGVLPTRALVWIFVDMLLVNLFFAALITAVACLIPNRFVTLVVTVVLVLAVAFVSNQLINLLRQPEYYKEYDYELVEITDDKGNVYVSYDIVPGSEHLVKNPYYVGGTLRQVLLGVEHASPYCHICEYYSMAYTWFGYGFYSEYNNEQWLEQVANNMPTEEDIHNTAFNSLYTLAMLAAVSTAGYFCFRKKELK